MTERDDRRPPPYKVLLVEDDDPVRNRFGRILNEWQDAQLVATCATLAAALETIRSTQVDLLVTDLKLPDGHGVQAIRALRASQPKAEAMVISVLADDRSVIDAIEAGASGYLLKDSDPINITEAIIDLMAGRSPISSTIARTLVTRLSRRDPAPASVAEMGDLPRLTSREMDILRGIAKGLTYAELAALLGISKQTVPVHIKSIYRKLEAGNRSEAVYEASRRGLIKL